MSAICLCGVCIPYSAILPLLLVLFQYLCRPLYRLGLIPEVLAKKLGIASSSSSSSSSCCKSAAEKETSATTSFISTESSISSTAADDTTAQQQQQQQQDEKQTIIQITSQEQLQKLMQTQPQIIILKFTADWCKPCKVIQPLYQKLANIHCSNSTKVVFGIVDVDEVEEVASEFKVAMMPTFIVLRDGKVVEKMSGANEKKLEDLVQQVICA
mmetsp:Transcript_1425/g.2607  ORF Transcript_1425/g.2607 Transcript_1425/m.2607 type:complete len:213 (+) Transcript_1425:223-861(+)